MVLNIMNLQVGSGTILLGLTAWQLSTGLRWIKLGRKHYTIHRYTGITLFCLGILHGLNGLNIAYGIFPWL
jgi:predicted ferric reductase